MTDLDIDDDEEVVLPPFEDLEHFIIDPLLNGQLYELLGMSPRLSNEEAIHKAMLMVDDIWSECAENSDTRSECYAMYAQIMESLFIKFYEDINMLLKLVIPHTITGILNINIPNRYQFEKLAFNVLYPLCESGYQYPVGNEFTTDECHSSTADNTWRGSSDADHDAIVKLLPYLPESWQYTAKQYLERTAHYLYGGVQINPEEVCT